MLVLDSVEQRLLDIKDTICGGVNNFTVTLNPSDGVVEWAPTNAFSGLFLGEQRYGCPHACVKLRGSQITTSTCEDQPLATLAIDAGWARYWQGRQRWLDSTFQE